MKILHYALGFPPYRTGGLTKFCMDLMLTQKQQGHTVGLLWPGEINPLKKQGIHRGKPWNEIENYEIINPLPVALDEGVADVKPYMDSGNAYVFEEFLKNNAPDVLHIHTLMGFHKEILEAAKKLGIKTVFTSHDYYGICSKVTLFRDGAVCENDNGCADCVKCNMSGLSQKKIMLMQSPLYRTLKNTRIVKALRKRHRTEFFDEEKQTNDDLHVEMLNESEACDYQKLRDFYLDILSAVDTVHFNSTVTKAAYLKYFNPKNSVVIPITHSDICDNKRIKKFDAEKIRISYLAPAKPFKGYGILKKALDELYQEGERGFTLSVYGNVPSKSPYMNINGGYTYSELEAIFDNTDVLIAPSVWYETFGFTVLEALSYGVPVIVSENVGAKDLVKDGFGFVCEPTADGVKTAVKELLDKSKLIEINKKIYDEFSVKTMQSLAEEIY